MQCEMLSKIPHPVLPLLCNVYISVTSLQLDQRILDTAVRQWRMCTHLSKQKADTYLAVKPIVN